MDIGESLPLLVQYEEIFKGKPAMRQVLGFIYADILAFHRSAMKHFRGRSEYSLHG
jgi:hypothetical protein